MAIKRQAKKRVPNYPNLFPEIEVELLDIDYQEIEVELLDIDYQEIEVELLDIDYQEIEIEGAIPLGG